MASVTASFSDSFTIQAPPELARDHFADVQAVARHYGKLKSFDALDAHTGRFVLPEHNYGVTRFSGRYTCRYEVVDERTVKWSTLGDDNNMDNAGTARFTAAPGGARLDYQATLVLDLDVGRLMRATIQAVAGRIVAEEMRGYVERMIAAVEADARRGASGGT